MSVETPTAPLPGVCYTRKGNWWEAPGRPSLSAVSRDLLKAGTYLPDGSTTGLLDPSALVDEQGARTYGPEYAGQTIRNRRFYGKVSVSGPNITFENCLFLGPATPNGQDPIVQCTNAGVLNLLFQDCEFAPRAPGSGTNCISGHHFTLLRCNLYRAVDCVGIIPQPGGRADVFIIASWLHGLVFFSPDEFQTSNATHNDLIQWHGGLGLTIFGCRLESFYEPTIGNALEPSVDVWNPTKEKYDHVSGNPYYPAMQGTSCLLVNQHVSVPGELDFRSNYVDGGGAGLVLSSAPGMQSVGRVEDNKFGRNFRNGPDYGVLANTGATQPLQTFTLTGNTRWDDGSPFNVRKKGD